MECVVYVHAYARPAIFLIICRPAVVLRRLASGIQHEWLIKGC